MIWKKPWNMAEGFLIGGGIMAVGLALQACAGPVRWELFAWPANIIALGVLLLAVIAMGLLCRRIYALRFLASLPAAVPAVAFAATLTVVMGLTRQAPQIPGMEPQGMWLNNMLSFWPFVLIYSYITLILGMVIVKRAATLITHHSSLITSSSSLLSHAGLFIAITTATLGNADIQRLQLWTTNNPEMANYFSGSEMFHQYERFAIDELGMAHELPLAIELKRFIIEMHDDSITPRRYASEVVIYNMEAKRKYAATIDVNKPAEVEGWKIYQKDYRLTEAGDACQISVLEVVRDPWLPWVYAGIFMMLAGAVLLPLSLRRTGN